MTITEINDWIAEELDWFRKGCVWRVHMCIFHNRIRIMQMNHCANPHPIIHVFTREEVEHGLTPEGWDKVVKTVKEYELRYKICRNPK